MRKTIRALGYAFNGLRYSFINERNFKIEIACACIAIAVSIFFKIVTAHWLVIVLNIFMVLTAELFNTAIEKLANVTCKEVNPAIKIVKDVAAAAVLMTVLSALVCALIIFIPYIFKMYSYEF